MTQWVRNPAGGRARGPRAVLRAWVEVLVRPPRFFRTGVAPGDQAPGLVFAVAVVGVTAALHVGLGLVGPGLGLSASRPGWAYGFGGSEALSAAVAWLLVTLLVGPLVLHLAAAAETVALLALAPDRGGVSETVQVLAYASAPCALAGLPVPALRAVCTLYGAVLLVAGTAIVHDTDPGRAFVASLVPGVAVFGYGFGGFAAWRTVLAALPA